MHWRKLSFLLILCFGFIPTIKATHIIGGEFEVLQRTGDIYDIYLNLYFDQVNGNTGAFDQQITIAIFEKNTNIRMEQLVLPVFTDSIVPYENPDCAVADLDIRRIRYKTTGDFKFSSNYDDPGGYYIVFDRCCRNNIITNIAAPQNAGMLFYLEFPPIYQSNGDLTNYSSPVFNVIYTRYACFNEYFYMDFGAEDADGDSLAFSMSTPINGNSSTVNVIVTDYQPAPYPLVSWLPGFNANDAIHGTPSLTVDPETGLLELFASELGLHVFSVTCSEYRNGVKIGEVRRDFQILVDVCPTNEPPNVLMDNEDRTGYYVEGDTIFVPNQGDRCFEFYITDDQDNRNNERIRVRVEPKNFTPVEPINLTSTTGLVGGPGDTLKGIKMCWPDCEFGLPEPYVVDVLVEDDGCILPKVDTITVTIIVEPEVNLPPELTVANATLPMNQGDTIFLQSDNAGCLNLEVTDSMDTRVDEQIRFLSYAFNVNGLPGTYNPTSVNIDTINPVGSSNFCMPTCKFTEDTTYEVFLIAEDDGCKDAKRDTFSFYLKTWPNESPDIQLTNPNTNGTYIEGDTILLVSDTGNCLSLSISDLIDERLNEQLRLSALAVGFTPGPGFGVTPTNLSTTALDTLVDSELCWSVCQFPDEQVYSILILAEDQSCVQSEPDTLEILVRSVVNLPPELELFNSVDSSMYQEGDTIFINKGEGDCFPLSIIDNQDFRDSELIITSISPMNFVGSQNFETIIDTSTILSSNDTLDHLDFCWPKCEYGLNIPYEIQIISENPNCGVSSSDTLNVTVIVNPNSPPELSYTDALPVTDTLDFITTILVDSLLILDFTGVDLNINDTLSMSAYSDSFLLEDFNMTFNGDTNTGGSIQGQFTWQPTCEIFQQLQSPLQIWFVVQDDDCFNSSSKDTIVGSFEVEEGERDAENFPMYNIFTPNGDGYNDVFMLPDLRFKNCTDEFESFVVYNRWGQEVWATQDEFFQWDGQDVTDGVYYYYVTYSDKAFKGYVTITR